MTGVAGRRGYCRVGGCGRVWNDKTASAWPQADKDMNERCENCDIEVSLRVVVGLQ